MPARVVCNPLFIPATDVTLVGGVPPVLTDEDIKDASHEVMACFASAPGGHDGVPLEVLVESGSPARHRRPRAQSARSHALRIDDQSGRAARARLQE